MLILLAVLIVFMYRIIKVTILYKCQTPSEELAARKMLKYFKLVLIIVSVIGEILMVANYILLNMDKFKLSVAIFLPIFAAVVHGTISGLGIHSSYKLREMTYKLLENFGMNIPNLSRILIILKNV